MLGTQFELRRQAFGATPVRNAVAPGPRPHSDRVLALQRTVGNAAVTRLLARDPIPWTFDPTVKPPVDLYPWQSKDPAKRQKAQDDLMWAIQRPNAVTISVSAKGLKDATKTVVDTPPAPSNVDAPTSAPAGSSSGSPGTVPVVTAHPLVKGVQVQVSYGLAYEGHRPAGSGSGKDGSPSTDYQSSAQVALTIVYHDEDQPGWEWSQQFQVNWSDTSLLRSLSPTALQNIQLGSQVAYVIPLWKNAQAQIFAQWMLGVSPSGQTSSQVAAGGQFQMKVTDHLSLFLQGGVGATQSSGASDTRDASVQGGVIYQF